MKNHEVVTRKEYIEREAAIVAIKNLYPGIPLAKIRLQKWHEENKNFMECELAVERIPAADVVPVVRCRDCKYNRHCFTQSFVRDESVIPFDPNTWFCADGKRTDGEP